MHTDVISKTVAFTLCSNNYLAQAKTLGDSFLKYHPDAQFVIGLVDTYHASIDYTSFKNIDVIPVDQICMPDLDMLANKFNIVELNTVVKPQFFVYLFKKYQAFKIIFLDPDVEVFSHFEELLNSLDTHNIILTPQNLVAIDDGNSPCDIDLLGTGIFNLGFIALSDYEKLTGFLKWWHDRLIKYGHADTTVNMFFDQLWMNLVPVFYDNYQILKHPGYNMSPSNLHERKVENNGGGQILVNKEHKLRFYHFSGYRYKIPEEICRYSKRFTFEERRDIIPLYKNYAKLLEVNNINYLSAITPFYCQKPSELLKVRSNKFLIMLHRIKRASKILMGKG